MALLQSGRKCKLRGRRYNLCHPVLVLISTLRLMMGDEGIQVEENPSRHQRATDDGKGDEGQGMNPDEGDQLNGEAERDEETRPTETVLDKRRLRCIRQGYWPPFQNVASLSVATSCTVSWQPFAMHDIWFDMIRLIMSGVLLCFGSSSMARVPA